ncbi:MAG: FHA domain-containing protein [Gammaproteobacteria bacterium]|jgi:hypothetical protein|nr:FHA domain-containing protein [Gammaproteobacteria bacterium]
MSKSTPDSVARNRSGTKRKDSDDEVHSDAEWVQSDVHGENGGPGIRRITKSSDGWQIMASAKPTRRLLLRCHEELLELTKTAAPIVVGRQLDCDVVLDDLNVSRSHARFEYCNGRCMLTDQSLNGTYVDTDFDGRVHLVQSRMFLYGYGIVSLGKPVRAGDRMLLHYFCS